MCIPSIIFRLKRFLSRARIRVWSKRKLWPVVAKWYGIPLSFVESGSIAERSPSQDRSYSRTLIWSFRLVWPIYCSGACSQGTEYTTWVEFQISFLGLLLKRRLPKEGKDGKKPTMRLMPYDLIPVFK